MTFTKPDDEKVMHFEEEIAYFYGARNSEPIAGHYVKALQELERLGIGAGKNILAGSMFMPLRQAYEEVQKQTSLRFDLDQAAQLELELILAQAQEESFESIYQLMIELYTIVFGVKAKHLHRSAMLRTFLYKYKISLLKMTGGFLEDDIDLLLAIAKASERELSRVNTKSRGCA